MTATRSRSATGSTSPTVSSPCRAWSSASAQRGLRAGIWIAPFLVGSRSRVAAEHPDWLVRDSDGTPVQALHNWGQDTHPLDVTHPAVREHLARVFGWFTGIGIDLFKIDFVYAAALAGRRHDPDVTDEQAYRDGLDEVRAAIGPDAYLLGCGAPLLPSVGKVDGMRVSADTAPQWAPEHGDMSLAGGASAELSVISRSYQHGRYLGERSRLRVAPARDREPGAPRRPGRASRRAAWLL